MLHASVLNFDYTDRSDQMLLRSFSVFSPGPTHCRGLGQQTELMTKGNSSDTHCFTHCCICSFFGLFISNYHSGHTVPCRVLGPKTAVLTSTMHVLLADVFTQLAVLLCEFHLYFAVVRKLQEFESPYISLKAAAQTGTHRIVLRKRWAYLSNWLGLQRSCNDVVQSRSVLPPLVSSEDFSSSMRNAFSKIHHPARDKATYLCVCCFVGSSVNVSVCVVLLDLVSMCILQFLGPGLRPGPAGRPHCDEPVVRPGCERRGTRLGHRVAWSTETARRSQAQGLQERGALTSHWHRGATHEANK